MRLIEQNQSPEAALMLKKREAHQDIFAFQGKLFRVNYTFSLPEHFSDSYAVKKLISQGDLISFQVLDRKEKDNWLSLFSPFLRKEKNAPTHVIRQRELPFENSAELWTSSMWISAARLIVRISLSLLEEDLEIVRASPKDIQFENTKAKFINPLAFQPIEPASFHWKAHESFRNHFLNPLVRFLRLNIPFQQSLLYENGVEPESLLEQAGWLRSLSPSLFSTALLPTLLNQQTKKPSSFPFFSSPTHAEVKEYRRQTYLQLLKAIDKIEENNLLKNKVETRTKTTYSTNTAIWIKEKINLFHPESFLEVDSQDVFFTRYASEIGISCISLQMEEKTCDKIFRESQKLSLKNLCLQGGLSTFSHSGQLLLLSLRAFQESLNQLHSIQEVMQRIHRLDSHYLILQLPEGVDVSHITDHSSFVLSDSFEGFHFFIRVQTET